MDKFITYEAWMLTDPFKGIYTKWTYYNDGSTLETKIPKGPIVRIEEDFEKLFKENFWEILA